MPHRYALLTATLLLTAALTTAAAPAATDPLLQTLQDELQRELAALQASDNPPYYLSLRVEDEQRLAVSASFGALAGSELRRTRRLTPAVRVGSAWRDNTHELRGSHSSSSVNDEGARAQSLPLDDDDLALRQKIWQAVDAEHRAAQQRYEKVKANIATRVKENDTSPDFSPAPAERHVEERRPLSVDRGLWEDRVRRLSALFAANADLIYGAVSFACGVERKYFASSEGSALALNRRYAQLSIAALAKADNGTELPLQQTFFAFSPDSLPPDSTLARHVAALSAKLSALKASPEVEAYSGPAILSAAAAGVFFHEIFGHRVEGQKLRSESDGQTFKKKVGEQVLPPYLSVSMSPTLRRFNGLDLNGHYLFDDEGVRAQNVEVVKDGILTNFLMSRTPVEGFPRSNGHARAEAGRQPTTRQSNLMVSVSHAVADDTLRRLLRDEAQRQGKAYGYYFASVVGGFTTTGRYMPNSFNVTPTEVYRVYVDGRPDELVRGVDLVGTPLAMFSQIEAVADSHEIFTGICGAESGSVPVTAISPALLVRMIEVQKKPKSQTAPPLLSKPSQCE